jgi:hypothetical protein
VSAAARGLWLSALALLAVGWFPPGLVWLHEHAQWSDMLVLLATMPWLLTRPWDRIPRRVWPPLTAWVVLSVLTTVARGGWTKVAGTTLLVALFLMTADLVAGAQRAAARVTQVAMVALAAVAVMGALLFHAGVMTPLLAPPGDLLPGGYARLRSLAFHPNLLASYAVFSFALSHALPPDDKLGRMGRIAAGIAALLALSRATVGLLVVAAVLRCTPRRAALVVGCAAALLVALTVVDLRIDPSRPWEATIDTRGGVRRQALTRAFGTALRHPLLGCGADCTPGPWDAHCAPVQIAATRGLPALGALGWLLWRLRPVPTRMTPAWAGLTALGVEALAQDVEDFRHLWVLMGIAASRVEPCERPRARSSRTAAPKVEPGPAVDREV